MIIPISEGDTSSRSTRYLAQISKLLRARFLINRHKIHEYMLIYHRFQKN